MRDRDGEPTDDWVKEYIQHSQIQKSTQEIWGMYNKNVKLLSGLKDFNIIVLSSKFIDSSLS